MEPDIVPDKIENKINYKIIILIISSTAIFQSLLYFVPNRDETNSIISVVSFINPLAASIASFIISKRYSGSLTFGKSYFALGIGYLSTTIGEILYSVYDLVLGIDPYPSIADVFFFSLYPFTIIHLLINTRFFKPKISVKEILWMTLIPVIIVSIYITSSLSNSKPDFNFYYGVIFTTGASTVLPFAILGAKVFKGGTIGTPWLVLVFAIVALTIGDVWYYHLEINHAFNLLHPVNIFWYAGYWILVYALYKHRKGI